MSAPSRLPTPSSSPANAQSQIAEPTTIPPHPMSISSVMAGDLLPTTPTPPDSRNTSFADNQAAETPQFAEYGYIEPLVKDPTLPATVEDLTFEDFVRDRSTAAGQDEGNGKDPEIYNTLPTEDGSAGNRLEDSAKYPIDDRVSSLTDREKLAVETLACLQNGGINCEAITAPVEYPSLHARLANWRFASGQGKGKGRDPEIYDTVPTADGSAGNGLEDNAAAAAAEKEAASRTLMLLLSNDTEQRNSGSVVAPNAKSHEGGSLPAGTASDHLHSSESEEEGTTPSAVRTVGFATRCHGNHLRHCAPDGDAVLEIPPLSSRHDPSSPPHHNDIDLHDGETRCRHCEAIHGSLRACYEQGYRNAGYEGSFEREETVPLDDDAADNAQRERYGAAEYDPAKYASAAPSNPPRLSRKQRERLEAEKRAWGRPGPDPLAAAASRSDRADDVDDASAPSPASADGESNARDQGDVVDPDSPAEEQAVDPAQTTPSPSPEQQHHHLPSRDGGSSPPPEPAPQMTLRSKRRAPTRLILRGPKAPPAPTEAGPSSPQKPSSAHPSLLTPPATSLKRKAPAPAEEEPQPPPPLPPSGSFPSQPAKKRKGQDAVPTSSAVAAASSSSSSSSSSSVQERINAAREKAVREKKDFFVFVNAELNWEQRWVDDRKGPKRWEERAKRPELIGRLGDIWVNATARKAEERKRSREEKRLDREAGGLGWFGVD